MELEFEGAQEKFGKSFNLVTILLLPCDYHHLLLLSNSQRSQFSEPFRRSFPIRCSMCSHKNPLLVMDLVLTVLVFVSPLLSSPRSICFSIKSSPDCLCVRVGGGYEYSVFGEVVHPVRADPLTDHRPTLMDV